MRTSLAARGDEVRDDGLQHGLIARIPPRWPGPVREHVGEAELGGAADRVGEARGARQRERARRIEGQVPAHPGGGPAGGGKRGIEPGPVHQVAATQMVIGPGVIEKLLYLFYEKHWDQAHPR